MAKINLVNEVLKHPEPEVIEYLTDVLNRVKNVYENWEKPEQLIACGTGIQTAYEILRGLDKRNKQKTGQDDTVVL